MQAGSVRFFASARVSVDGQPGEAHSLAQDEPGYWPTDEYAPIGAAQWELPEVRHGQSIALVITAGYVFETARSDEHTSELQSLMRISYAVFCLKTKQHKST